MCKSEKITAVLTPAIEEKSQIEKAIKRFNEMKDEGDQEISLNHSIAIAIFINGDLARVSCHGSHHDTVLTSAISIKIGNILYGYPTFFRSRDLNLATEEVSVAALKACEVIVCVAGFPTDEQNEYFARIQLSRIEHGLNHQHPYSSLYDKKYVGIDNKYVVLHKKTSLAKAML